MSITRGERETGLTLSLTSHFYSGHVDNTTSYTLWFWRTQFPQMVETEVQISLKQLSKCMESPQRVTEGAEALCGYIRKLNLYISIYKPSLPLRKVTPQHGSDVLRGWAHWELGSVPSFPLSHVTSSEWVLRWNHSGDTRGHLDLLLGVSVDCTGSLESRVYPPHALRASCAAFT